MWLRTMALVSAFMIHGAPALALDYQSAKKATPKKITSIGIANYEVQMLAVTQRARADTPLRRRRMEEAHNMGKVLPGFPQPAFVSVDFRIEF